MTIKIRDYQEELISETRLAMRENNSVVMQSPTGSGKCQFCANDMPPRKNNFKRAFKFCDPACAGAYKHKIFSTPMNDLLCCECGEKTSYESRKLYNLAKCRARAY